MPSTRPPTSQRDGSASHSPVCVFSVRTASVRPAPHRAPVGAAPAATRGARQTPARDGGGRSRTAGRGGVGGGEGGRGEREGDGRVESEPGGPQHRHRAPWCERSLLGREARRHLVHRRVERRGRAECAAGHAEADAAGSGRHLRRLAGAERGRRERALGVGRGALGAVEAESARVAHARRAHDRPVRTRRRAVRAELPGFLAERIDNLHAEHARMRGNRRAAPGHVPGERHVLRRLRTRGVRDREREGQGLARTHVAERVELQSAA